MFFRLILWVLLLYIIVKVSQTLLSPGKNKTEVHGKSRQTPIDLSRKDIEDIDYKETPEDKS
jgi:hypothetical protein